MQTAQAPSSQTIQEIVSDSIGAFLNGIGDFLPNILAALLILFVGWIIARVFKAGVGRVLRTIKFPMLAERAGIDGFLKTGGVKQTSTDLLAVLVYWLLMLIVLVTAVNALRLEMASQLLNQIMLRRAASGASARRLLPLGAVLERFAVTRPFVQGPVQLAIGSQRNRLCQDTGRQDTTTVRTVLFHGCESP